MTDHAEHIRQHDARRIILTAQGWHKKEPFGRGINSLPRIIDHLGYVQIDTISVIARAHHHILWNRTSHYDPTWLEKAQYQKREIFEYWAHAAAYLPMADYRFSLPVMQVFRDKKDRWPKSGKQVMKEVLKRIEIDGPVMSRHFESDHKGGSWWDWKPAKWALQRLYLEGRIMISHRENFQRVYDLPERIIPSHIDTTTPTLREYYTYLITNTIKAQGLAGRKDLIHLRHIDHKTFDLVLHELLEAEQIVAVKPETKGVYYTTPEQLEQRNRIITQIQILSPFDNTVIWRKRLKEIFDFDYTLECYVPSAKRQFGYFCLPILFGTAFIGRMDVKADRKNETLQIHHLYLKPKYISLLKEDRFSDSLQAFAVFNGCHEIKWPKKIKTEP